MKLISRLRGRCFCAFCKAERKIYLKKHVDLTNVGAALLLSVAVGQAYWGQADPRALVIFCVTVVGMETFIYLRWRAAIICSLCGFDPILYKRSPALAAQRVREFYQEREDDPGFWLTRSPLLEKQRARRAQERKAQRHAQRAAAPASKSLAPKPGANKVSPVASPKSP